jgi:hypothetical protein
MVLDEKFVLHFVDVNTEGVDELIDLMKKDDLTVEVK